MKRPVFLVAAAILLLDLWFIALMSRRDANAPPPDAPPLSEADARRAAARAERAARADRVPRGDGIVRGVVRDRFGAPVGGARVELHTRDIRPGAPLETHGRAHTWRVEGDAGGVFSIAGLPPGGYALRAVAGALHAMAATEIEPGGPAAEVALVLEPTRLVDGQVLGADDKPVSGAWVYAAARAAHPGPAPLYRLFPAPTDAQGRFAFPFLAVDTWRFLAVLRGEVAMLSDPVPPGDPRVVLRTAPAANLAVRLVEPGGAPANRFAVEAIDRDLGLERHRAASDLYGVVRFTGLREAVYTLRVDSQRHAIPPAQADHAARVPDAAPAPQGDGPETDAPPETHPTIALDPVGTFRGRVVDADDLRGIAGVPVAFAGQPDSRAWTDASGYYRVGPVPPGEYRVEVARPKGHAIVGDAAATARMPEPAVAAGPDFVLKRGVNLGGRVLDAAGLPVADANVFVSFRGDARPDWGTRTGPDGTFQLAGFWQDAGLRVWAERLDLVSLGAGPIEVATEDTHGVSLALRLPRTAAIRGRVVAQDDTGIGGARVWCHVPDPSLAAPLRAEADATGAFHFDGLIPGVYRVAAAPPGADTPGPETILQLDPGETAANTRLPIAE